MPSNKLLLFTILLICFSFFFLAIIPSRVSAALEGCSKEVTASDPVCGEIDYAYDEERDMIVVTYSYNYDDRYISAGEVNRGFNNIVGISSDYRNYPIPFNAEADKGIKKTYEIPSEELAVLKSSDSDSVSLNLTWTPFVGISQEMDKITISEEHLEGGPNSGDGAYIKSITYDRDTGKHTVVVYRRRSFNNNIRYGLRVHNLDGDPVSEWPTTPYSYSCTGENGGLKMSKIRAVFGPKEVTVECDFSNLPKGDNYDLDLKKFRNDETYQDTISDYKALFVDGAEITSVENIIEPIPGQGIYDQVTKKFTIKVTHLFGAEGGTHRLWLSNKDSGGETYEVCTFNESADAAESTTICDFSSMKPEKYWLILDTPSTVGMDAVEIRIPELVNEDETSNGLCTCNVSGCTDAGTWESESEMFVYDGCYLGTTATVLSCNPPIAGVVPSGCECGCVGLVDDQLPAEPPTGGVGTAPDNFHPEDLTDWIRNTHLYLIAFGVISSLFIAPYAFILMATGNPENIKKGMEWLQSLAIGLMVLLLSGTIIRIIGTNLLGL